MLPSDSGSLPAPPAVEAASASPWFQTDALLPAAVILAVIVGAAFLLTFLIRKLRGSTAERPLRMLRGLGLPLAGLLAVLPVLGQGAGGLAFRLVETGLSVVGAYAGVLLIRTWFVRRREAQSGRAAPRLLIDIVTFGVVVITVALLLSNVWGLPVSNTLSTLGLGSIVIGLALQDTLGNLFAGVSLMTERPYVIGDWITIDDLEGRVVEVNWRAVHVMTRNQDLVILPNATVAASIITNEVRPTQLKAIPVNVGFSYNDPPNKVKAVLRRAALATQGVRREPEPTIRVTGYGDSSIDYEVRLFLDNHDERPDILDRFNARIWYAAKRSGLNIPFPIRTVYHQRMPPPDEVAAHDRMACLRGIDIFRPLEDEDLKRLAQSARLMVFGHDEHVVKQGDRDDAMYALLSGEANVVVDEAEGGRGTVVGRLKAGSFFGEMAALTGEPRTASVVADRDLEVLAIRSDGLREVLETRPELAEAIAGVVTERRTQLDTSRRSVSAANAGPTSSASSRHAVAARIRGFLGL